MILRLGIHFIGLILKKQNVVVTNFQIRRFQEQIYELF